MTCNKAKNKTPKAKAMFCAKIQKYPVFVRKSLKLSSTSLLQIIESCGLSYFLNTQTHLPVMYQTDRTTLFEQFSEYSCQSKRSSN